MKIVIDIPDIDYEHIKEYYEKNDNVEATYSYIYHGTPLPPGHGRLIDADAFIAMMEDVTERQRYNELLIDDGLTVDDVIDAIIESLKNEGLAEGDAPTIIPAESENPT